MIHVTRGEKASETLLPPPCFSFCHHKGIQYRMVCTTFFAYCTPIQKTVERAPSEDFTDMAYPRQMSYTDMCLQARKLLKSYARASIDSLVGFLFAENSRDTRESSAILQ